MNDIEILLVNTEKNDDIETIVDAFVHIESVCFKDEAWSRDFILRFLDNQTFLTLAARTCRDGNIIGMLSSFAVCDEAEITTVAVLPEYRRQGVAKRLMSTLESYLTARGVCRMLLEVREGNAPARALYAALGFKEYSRRRGYYTSPREDAVLMEKHI